MPFEVSSNSSGSCENQSTRESKPEQTSARWHDASADEIWIRPNSSYASTEQTQLPEHIVFTPLDWGRCGAQSRPLATMESVAARSNSNLIVDVDAGDCLYTLAQRHLGDPNRWSEIYALNKNLIGENPNLIQIGMCLQMPDDASSAALSSSVSTYDGTQENVHNITGDAGDFQSSNTSLASDIRLNDALPAALQIMDFFVQKGLSAKQAAGIVGNLQYESGLNPAIEEIGNGIGYGLAQWSFERRENLRKFAESFGEPMSDLTVQLEFLWSELNGPENATLSEFAKNPSMSATQAGHLFYDLFERPLFNSQNRSDRSAAAEQFFNQYQDSATLSASYDAPTSNQPLAVTTSDLHSAFMTEFQSKYNPNGPSSSVDCGSASLAMAVRLSGKQYPGGNPEDSQKLIEKVKAFADVDTYLTNLTQLSRSAQKAGFSTEKIHGLAAVNEALRTGKSVLLVGNPGNSYEASLGPNAYGNSNGYDHIVLVAGYNADNTYTVLDPLSRTGPIKLSEKALQAYIAGVRQNIPGAGLALTT